MTNGVLRQMPVKVGQTVLLPMYAGVKLKLADEKEYWVYRDDDILGILEEPNK
jgi:co-chaperonin GroES (HSP10)